MAMRVRMNWPKNPWHMAYAVRGQTVRLFQREDSFGKRDRVGTVYHADVQARADGSAEDAIRILAYAEHSAVPAAG